MGLPDRPDLLSHKAVDRCLLAVGFHGFVVQPGLGNSGLLILFPRTFVS